jgi:enamine deaminase RidA (YjgF/YER057c/UK114 family)
VSETAGGVRRVSSGAPWEQIVGYSRAVAAGDYIFVTGCTSVRDGEIVHDGDPKAQAEQAIGNVAAALEALGAALSDVVRTRIFVTDISQWPEVGEAHRTAFAAGWPATSMVQVAALIDPRLLVEVEAVAYRPRAAGGAGLGWPA